MSTAASTPNLLISPLQNNLPVSQSIPAIEGIEDHPSSLSLSGKASEKRLEETRKLVKELEKSNESLAIKINRAKKSLDRLRLERKLLFEKLENLDPELLQTGAGADSSDDDEISDGAQSDHSDTLPKKRKSKRKDPNAPKKPSNAFFLFSQIERDIIRSNNPAITRAELTRLLGNRWKSLGEEEKQKFYALYEKEKERYAIEMAEYTGAPFNGASIGAGGDGMADSNMNAEEIDNQIEE